MSAAELAIYGLQRSKQDQQHTERVHVLSRSYFIKETCRTAVCEPLKVVHP